MRYEIPSRLNLALAGAAAGLNIVALFALPTLLAQSWLWAALIVPIATTSSMQWGLIHDAIHKILSAEREENEQLGRALAILLGTSFHVLRFGHLMHHKLNRGWHSEYVPQRTFGSRIAYYWHLLFGLYASEIVISAAMALLSRKNFMAFGRRTFLKGYEEVAVSGERFFYEQGHAEEARVDMACVLLLYGLSLAAYGTYWPVLVAFILLRGAVISFLDNIYHYATPADNSKPGKELVLPPALSLFLLHSNYHETHHVNPLVPWRLLPEIHAAQARDFDGDFLTHGLRQLDGPLTA